MLHSGLKWRINHLDLVCICEIDAIQPQIIQFYFYSLLIMFQTTSDLSINDNKSEVAGLNNEVFSLPNIPKKPVSRGEPVSKKQSNKQKLVLPRLFDSEMDGENFNSLDRDKENYQFKNKNLFAREVKERLNLVLGEMPHISNGSEENGDSDDLDFEEKINQNKEIIKQHKLKKENEKNNQPQRLKISKEQKNNRPKKSRNQSLYQKRVKQYRQESIENKYLQKRKQTVKDQNQQNAVDQHPSQQNTKEIKQKDEQSQAKNGKYSAKKSLEKRGVERMLSQRSSQKNLLQPKNDSLFDCIQNYLENPHENKKQNGPKNLVGLTLLKAKRDIEDKIKAINQKLGVLESEQRHVSSRANNINVENSARDWRRVQIGINNIEYQTSTFDKQIDRISSLQQRNSMCLEKYLEQQKILLDLELRRSQLARKNANSH